MKNSDLETAWSLLDSMLCQPARTFLISGENVSRGLMFPAWHLPCPYIATQESPVIVPPAIPSPTPEGSHALATFLLIKKKKKKSNHHGVSAERRESGKDLKLKVRHGHQVQQVSTSEGCGSLCWPARLLPSPDIVYSLHRNHGPPHSPLCFCPQK